MSFPYASLTSLMWQQRTKGIQIWFECFKVQCFCWLRWAKESCNQYLDLLLLLRDDFSKKTHFKGRQHLASSGISSIPQRCALTSSVPPVNCIIPVSPMLPGEVRFWYLLQSSIRNTTFSLGTLVPECLSTHESAPNHWPLFIYSEQLPTTLRQMKGPSYTKITDADLMISLGFEWGAQSASK